MKSPKLPLIIFVFFLVSFLATQVPDAHGGVPPCVQPSSGMISWWDGDNNTLDLASGNNGTLVGGATYAPGMVGQAFSFDGVDGHVDLPDGFADFTSGFTVALWANPTSYGYWARFIDLGNGQADNNILFDRRSTSTDLALEVYDGYGSSTGMAYAVDAITNNEWHHYAATLDAAGKVKMYKDGLPLVLAADTTGLPNNVTRTSNFIGRSNWLSDGYYAGSLDEVQIFNRVLDAAEIAAIFNAGSAGNCKPQCTPPPSGMVSWWTGDSSTNDIIGGYNGTLVNGAAYGPGKVGQAFSFDGTNQHVELPEPVGDFGATAFSVDFWIYTSDPGSTSGHYILGKSYPDGGQGWDVRYYNRTVTVEGWSFEITSDAITLDEWHHIAVSATASDITLYIDGVVKGTSGRPASITSTSNPFRIGYTTGFWPYTGTGFNGLIDEVEIFNRALSDTEIAAIYNAGSAGKCGLSCVTPPSNMVSWWDAEGDANDMVGTNHGTLINGATYGTGKVGQAFSFDGTANSYVEIADHPSLNPTDAFTIDGWFYIDPNAPGNVGGESALAAKTSGGVGDGGWFLWFQDSAAYTKALRFDIMTWGSPAWPYAEVNNAITSAGWYHIAGVFDLASSPQAKLYLNGVLVASSTSTIGAIVNNTLPVRIGASHWTDVYQTGGNDRLEGMADEVEFFNRALTASEIQDIYNAGSAGKCRSCTSPPSGMVSWWGGDNNALDLVGTNNGTSMNGATYAAGEVGQAFSFDGNDDFVDVGAGDEFNFDNGTGDFTIDAWINPSALRAYPIGIIAKAAYMPVYSGWAFYVSDAGALTFGSPDGLGPLSMSSAAGTISAGIWTHVAVTKTGTTYTMYKNGVEVHSGNYVNLPTSTNPLRLGTVYDDSERFPGFIDEIQIFSRALTVDEISAIYNAGSEGTCSIDMMPEGFTFNDVTDAVIDTEYISNAISVTGINYVSPISITGGEYAVSGDGGSTWSSFSTTTPETVNINDRVKVRQISSGSYSTTTETVLTVGGVSDIFSVMTRPGADLSITKTDAGYDPIKASDKVTYTITVTNLGPDAASMVNLTDDLPAGVVADPVPDCSYNTELNQVSCLLAGTLFIGESIEKTITVTVPSTPGVITNTASVTSDTEDPDLTNNTASQDTTVRTTLTVSIMPDSGSGTVTASGIDCGQGNTDCTEAFSSATDVSLTATAAAGWRFLRWEGSLTGSTDPDTVSMSAHRSVTAVFATDRTVCADPLVCFTSIQAAIDEAGPGDEIKLLRDTTYNENLSISTAKELTISGGWDGGFGNQTPDPSTTVISGDVDGDTIGDGPVLAVTAGSSIALENLTLANGNSASGGGIKIEPSDGPVDLSLTIMMISDNVAGDGAGVFMSSTSSSTPITLNVFNTIISNNWTASRGGGISAFASSGGAVSVNMTNSTVTGNRAVTDGAGTSFMVVDTGTVTASIANGIIWGNLLIGTLAADDIFADGATVTASYSDMGAGTFTDLGGNISADPVFLNSAAGDYRLNSDSPAIDAGNNTAASDLSTDIAGQTRMVDGNSDSTATVDMGAHEYQPTTPSGIKLLSLNGGDIIDAGMPFDIVWEAPASAQRFKVFYSLDNGLTWLKAVSADPAVTGNIVTGQQHFRWAVPAQAKNKKCKVKVTGYTGAGVKVGTDTSDLLFILRAASLVRPNGPDPLHYGETYTIRWITTERPKGEVTTVKLSYTMDGGLTWKAIGSPITGNPGSYSWTVPTLAKPKTKCKVKVDLYSGTAKVGSDASDYFFAIGP